MMRMITRKRDRRCGQEYALPPSGSLWREGEGSPLCSRLERFPCRGPLRRGAWFLRRDTFDARRLGWRQRSSSKGQSSTALLCRGTIQAKAACS